MRFGSVCSGIEAASIAWEPLGWKSAWFSEIEPFPCAVLAHHYPGTPNIGDMTALPERILSGEIEAPEMFCGGTPCQAFSVAGLRKSLDDDRGNLSLVFCDIANAIDSVRTAQGEQPCIVFWENVPGVLSTSDNAFGCFLAGLAGEDDPLVAPGGKWTNAGYVLGPKRAVAWRVTDAQYFGVAQRRRRVFVVASARDGFDTAAVLFEFDGVRRDTAPSRDPGEEAAGTITGGARSRGGYSHDDTPLTAATMTATDYKDPQMVAVAHVDTMPCMTAGGPSDTSHNQISGQMREQYVVPVCVTGSVTHTLKAEGFDASEDGTGRGQPIVVHGTQDPCVSEHTAFALGRNNGGENAVAYVIRTANTSSNGWGIQEEATHTLDRAMGLAVAFTTEQTPKFNEDCALTLTKQSPTGGGRIQSVMSAMQFRRLTPRECERLQGFPDNYTLIPWRNKPAEECPDGPRYKALGNSWSVPNVRWIGRRIDLAVELSISKSSKGDIIK